MAALIEVLSCAGLLVFEFMITTSLVYLVGWGVFLRGCIDILASWVLCWRR